MSELSEKIEPFLQHLRAQRYSEHTLSNYEMALQRFSSWVGNRPCVWNSDTGREWIASQVGYAAGTVCLRLLLVRAWARFLGVSDAFPGVRGPKTETPRESARRRCLSIGDALALVEAPRRCRSGSAATRARDAAVLSVLVHTGLRVGELCALDLGDVGGGFVSVRRGKGGKSRQVPIGEDTTVDVATWVHHRAGWLHEFTTALFVNQRGRRIQPKEVQRLMAAYLPKGCKASPHWLRHTFATHVHAEANGDVLTLQEMLGHSSSRTTEIYVKVTPARMRAVHGVAFPKRAA